MTERFFQKFVKLVDRDASLLFNSNATTEWLVLWIETLQNFTLFTAAFLLVVLSKGQTTDPGNKNSTRTEELPILFTF